MRYRGSCHCGNIAFEVEGLIDKALACNCSICSRKGSLLWFVPRAQLTIHAADGNVGTYQFTNMGGDERDVVDGNGDGGNAAKG